MGGFDGVQGGSLVLATAPGFSRVRPHRRGEALGLTVIESDAATLGVATYTWDGRPFEQIGRRVASAVADGGELLGQAAAEGRRACEEAYRATTAADRQAIRPCPEHVHLFPCTCACAREAPEGAPSPSIR